MLAPETLIGLSENCVACARQGLVPEWRSENVLLTQSFQVCSLSGKLENGCGASALSNSTLTAIKCPLQLSAKNGARGGNGTQPLSALSAQLSPCKVVDKCERDLLVWGKCLRHGSIAENGERMPC